MPIDESLKFLPVNIAVLTVSDTRDMASDRSGQTLQDRIEAARHHCVAREIVKMIRMRSRPCCAVGSRTLPWIA